MIIENDAQCQINTNLVNIECEINNEQMKIKIISGSLIHNMSYSILVNKIKILGNHINFQMSAFTQNNFLQQQSQYTHVINQQSQLKSSEFLEFTFDPIDSEYQVQSSYNLFFENAINIPAQGILQLSATELNINFLLGQVIEVSGNEAILKQKIIKQDQKFSLLFYFEKEVLKGMHLFRLQNISNPHYEQKKEYYNFQLESYDQNNNLLEYKVYDLYFVFICPQSKCLICNQQDYCDKCEADYVLYQGQCLKECPTKTVLVNNQCQRCNVGASCLICSNVDTVLCVKCNDGYDLINGFCIWTTNVNQNQSSSNNITNNSNIEFNQNSTILTNQQIQTQLKFDVHIFAIIVLSLAILCILRNIQKKQTDFQNAYLAFSGLSDFTLQFITFFIIIINYTIFQSIISLTLCFLTILQQLYAYQTIKLQLQVDFGYQKCQDTRFAQILRFLTLYIDWKVILIHKSCITNSELFSIKFQNEIKLLRLIYFFFLIKISINIINLGMLGIILITQDQIAQLIQESIFYNLAMILIQLNKMYQIKLTLKNYNHKDILIDQINLKQDNQEQHKITAKVTPESMIIQQD